MLRQPLPIECRDTVTGHAFSNGCVDEMTWYLEDKSIWAAAMAMSLALLHVNKSMSLKIHFIDLQRNFFLLPNFSLVVDVGRECSFGNHSYASIETRGKSYVPKKLGRVDFFYTNTEAK